MKLTKSQLKKIIKEELDTQLTEAPSGDLKILIGEVSAATASALEDLGLTEEDARALYEQYRQISAYDHAHPIRKGFLDYFRKLKITGSPKPRVRG
jgi:hypothetical protein